MPLFDLLRNPKSAVSARILYPQGFQEFSAPLKEIAFGNWSTDLVEKQEEYKALGVPELLDCGTLPGADFGEVMSTREGKKGDGADALSKSQQKG